MGYYIDAYDWVMIANVYSMICYSDGGLITTKPYIASSNYIFKMSNDYTKNSLWAKIWDGLYWRFLYKHKHRFQNNIRMKMQLSILEKMDKSKLDNHINHAESFIKEMNLQI